MQKFKGTVTVLAAVLVWAGVASAQPEFTPEQTQAMIVELAKSNALSLQENVVMVNAGLQWKVGDKASYQIDGGFIKGTTDSVVRSDEGNAFWVQQDTNLGFMGKQKIEILFNKADGQILKFLVNGQEQEVPSGGDFEVIEMKEDRIKVKAGEFDCIYIKLTDKKENKAQEAWINPKAVPMSGMIKSLSETQFGPISQELTSFSFAN